jgi:hypothetical protein
MWDALLAALVLVGLVIAGLWFIGLPGDDEDEELAGFVTANWDEVKRRITHH